MRHGPCPGNSGRAVGEIAKASQTAFLLRPRRARLGLLRAKQIARSREGRVVELVDELSDQIGDLIACRADLVKRTPLRCRHCRGWGDGDRSICLPA
jgi:hypothetical protein